MFFLDTNTDFHIVSVIELSLSEQQRIIPPRPFHILSFRLSGNALLETSQGLLQLKDDDLLYVPSGCSYSINSGNEQLILINFTMSNCPNCSVESYTPLNPVVFQDAFSTLNEVWTLKRDGYYFRAMSTFYKILEHMNRQFSPTTVHNTGAEMQDALNYLHLHFTDHDISIAKLCSIANLSDTQFRKKFFEIHATTPLNYINTLRVNYAADLLSNSPFSIDEIALASGFSDYKYFSTVFKKYKHTTPSGFRKIN